MRNPMFTAGKLPVNSSCLHLTNNFETIFSDFITIENNKFSKPVNTAKLYNLAFTQAVPTYNNREKRIGNTEGNTEDNTHQVWRPMKLSALYEF